MYAVLSPEWIGQNIDQEMRGLARLSRQLLGENLVGEMPTRKPWVARITSIDDRYGLSRTFLDGQIDYSQANSIGSRGIYLHFALPNGFYEVKEYVSWKSNRRYFIYAYNGTLRDACKEEVEEWIRSRLHEGE